MAAVERRLTWVCSRVIEFFNGLAGERSRSLSRAQRAATPIEEKESRRWIDAFRRAGEESQRCPSTQLVCVGDSEADIYELLAEATTEPRRIDWIIRAGQNRALWRGNAQDTAEKYVREHVRTQPVLLTHTIQVRGRKAKVEDGNSFVAAINTIQVRGRKAKVSCETRGRRQPRQSRQAEMEVRAARVTLRPPRRADRKLPEVTVNVVLVSEVDPPENDVPVEWLLLTSLPVDEIEQVRQVIQYYCVRWMIEVFFRVLKSGCRVVWPSSVAEANSLGHTLVVLRAMPMLAWACGDENHNTLLTNMATPEPTGNMSVSRCVAMPPRALPRKMATPVAVWKSGGLSTSTGCCRAWPCT